MMNIFRAYNRLMNNHPIKIQCITAGVLVASGDVISQKLIENQQHLNVQRTAKFFVFGLCFIGPSIAIWYRFLDRRFGRNKEIILKPWQKVLVDQALFNPAINLVALPVLGILNRNTIKEIQDNIEKNYIDIMLASYRIWPMVQMINFYIVPLNYRAVFASVVSLIWNSYYTWKLGEKADPVKSN